MDVYRLDEDELSYELSIRGITGISTAETMRNTLKKLLKLERAGKLTVLPKKMELKHWLAFVNRKVHDVETVYRTTPEPSLIQWETVEHPEEYTTVSPRPSTSFAPLPSPRVRPPYLDGPVSLMDRDFEETAPVRVLKPQLLIKDWGIKFSGDGSGTSLQAFLEDVKHYRKARNITYHDLFNGAIDFFQGTALFWYKSIRRDVRSWWELEALLREEFEGVDYEDDLLIEILSRTQGEDEKLSTYVAIMRTYFARLPTPLPEDRKVRILLKNICPYYYDRLRGEPIETVADLLRRGRRIQRGKEHMENFRPPPAPSSSLLEPELAYHPTRSVPRLAVVSTVSKDDFTESSRPSTSRSRPSAVTSSTPKAAHNKTGGVTTLICWNCKLPGHRFQQCPTLKIKFCTRCGCEDLVKGNCRRCAQKCLRLEQKAKVRGPPRTTKVLERKTSPKEWTEWIEHIRICSAISNLEKTLNLQPGDPRPYLTLQVLGKPIQGLLDSGASRTLVGSSGWVFLRSLGLTANKSEAMTVTVADGRLCQTEGVVDVPFELSGTIKVIPVLIVPSLETRLILGIDFWRAMKVVPDVSTGTWHFNENLAEISINQGLADVATLNKHQTSTLEKLITEFRPKNPSLGCTTLVEHVIDVGDATPIKQRYYPVSPPIQKAMNAELDQMLSEGVVEKSKSPWSSPVVMVKKSDGTLRFCVDYRKVNAVTKRDAYPLPYVSHILDRLRNAKCLSSLDLKSAYWQVPVANRSREYTAFTVPGRGLYQFKRLPFGLHNSPATWQRLIDNVLGPDLEPFVFVYLDDIVVITASFEEHIRMLRLVFERLTAAGLTLNWDKCQFCRKELRYLGYIVDGGGLRVDPEKVEVIINYPAPKTPKQIRRFLGLVSWYRRFVPEFSSMAAPINNLLKKEQKWNWSPECQSAFQSLKEALVCAPVLTGPDFNEKFIVTTDASQVGLGATLSQLLPEGERVIAYASRSLTKAERNYAATELECLAVVWAVEKFRPYLEGLEFTVVTDHHSLKWLQNLKDPAGRLARWVLRLQQYNFTIEHRPGRLNSVADALSRAPYEPVCVVSVQEGDMDNWYLNMVKRVSDEPDKYPLWKVDDGKLKKRIRQKHSDPIEWKIVVPKRLRRTVICEAHDKPTSGHLGTFKTHHRVAEMYYWPGMHSDVARYVAKCRVCLATKPEQRRPKGLMGNQRLPEHPWQYISTDLMGPFPPSSKQNRYLLVVSDLFSKFVIFYPLRTANAQSITRLIEQEIFLKFGVPETLICDNGAQYRSGTFKELLKSYNVRIQYTPLYSAQCNPTERVNRVIKTSISAYVKENHRSWDKLLPKIQFAINTACHESSGHPPAYLNFGRRLCSSGDEHTLERTANSEEPDQTISIRQRTDKIKQLQDVQDMVKRKLAQAFQKNASPYNLRRRQGELNVGDEVWKRTYPLSDASKYFTAKLAPKYEKCVVVEKESPLIYVLANENGDKIGRWHIKDLKSTSSSNSVPDAHQSLDSEFS